MSANALDRLDDAVVAELSARLRKATDPVRRVLVDGQPTPADTETAQLLVSSGLARRERGVVLPLVRVDEWAGLLLFHDPGDSSAIEPESVIGTNNTTRTLATLTPRRKVRRALDLATGPGGPALLAARHADHVVASDLSERACAFARLNARVAGAVLDVRQGDLFDPVVDEAPFDLITGNLPFVISPDRAFTFRDGGRDRDELSVEAVVGASSRLEAGGTAIFLCNWTVTSDRPASTAPLDWLPDPSATVVALHHSTETPADYARRWNRFLLAQDPSSYDTAVERWTTAFDDWGIDGIANGVVIVRRPDREPAFRRSLPMTTAASGDGGAQVDRLLANGAWLAEHDEDRDLLAHVPRLVAPNQLHQRMDFDGDWSSHSARMTLLDSAGVTADVHPLATHVVLRIDGRHSVDQLISEAAAETGLDADALTSAALTSLRRLVEAGCIDIVP